VWNLCPNVVASSGPVQSGPASSCRWMTYLGYGSAVLIATGIVIPLGLEAAALTNFAGYVAWCLWLIAMAVVLWRTPPASPGAPTATMTGSDPVGTANH
jgi:hypothetical protein